MLGTNVERLGHLSYLSADARPHPFVCQDYSAEFLS